MWFEIDTHDPISEHGRCWPVQQVAKRCQRDAILILQSREKNLGSRSFGCFSFQIGL